MLENFSREQRAVKRKKISQENKESEDARKFPKRTKRSKTQETFPREQRNARRKKISQENKETQDARKFPRRTKRRKTLENFSREQRDARRKKISQEKKETLENFPREQRDVRREKIYQANKNTSDTGISQPTSHRTKHNTSKILPKQTTKRSRSKRIAFKQTLAISCNVTFHLALSPPPPSSPYPSAPLKSHKASTS
ncbi:uncharacterized protein [Palaemon carinicauda]|uniref:uncharacterized protein n=1 Tax=Palaemon carinicauda TaxID=392227 RepID=UPI0035B69F34